MREGLNKAILVGNLGMDPELKFTTNQKALLRLRLATSDSYTNQSGERQERTEWHTVVIWGKRAEALGKFLTKGTPLCIEGRIQTRSWEDQQGGKRYATEIVASNIILLGSGSNNRSQGDEYGMPSSGPDDAFAPPAGASGGGNQFAEDDIPF